MVLPERKVKFVVGLSNGEILIEREGILSVVKGEDSPWWKLQKYIKDNDLEIRSMYLVSKTKVGNRHYNLPNEKGKFKGITPSGFNCFRYYATDGLSGDANVEHYCVAEAIYPEYRVQLWISELDPDKSWVNVRTTEQIKEEERMSFELKEPRDEKESK